MDPGTAAALTAVTAGISAATSVYGAAKQNQAVKASQKAASRNAAVRQRQLNTQSQIESYKREQESQRAKAAIRAAAAGAGALFDGSSYAALSTQVEIDRDINSTIADMNLRDASNRNSSELDATLTELSGMKQNVLVSGLQGAIQGAQAGLALSGGMNSLFPAAPTETPFPIDPSYMAGSTAFGSNRPR